jgi:xylan 1,4-beta-xylosidase
MGIDYARLPRAEITIDATEELGPLEGWRHTLGHGGINALPLPPRVVEGARKLRPRLIRVFLQEHFAIFPERGRYDWSRLDPFMEALAQTGAKVVAAICLKPPVLFPRVDQSIWRPTDWAEWQQVIRELVTRYSVAQQLVTYWEVGNETDIGEMGGCPYLIADPKEYGEYYAQTVQPVLEVFPEAKVGGPASCWVTNEPLPGLIRYCRETGVHLDFISWHCYHDNPEHHAAGLKKARELLADFPGARPELLVTEWNKSFDPVSCEDMAFAPRRAANVAAGLLAMLEAGLEWSCYYHLWDQTFYRQPFTPFFSDKGLEEMEHHWNRAPHRFGLFGVSGEVRPQYFVYWMLARLGEARLAAAPGDASLRVLAAKGAGKVSVLVVNFDLQQSRDLLVTVRFTGLQPGVRMLRAYRIDEARRWEEETLEMRPLEQREVDIAEGYRCSVYCPADSVVLVELEDLSG